MKKFLLIFGITALVFYVNCKKTNEVQNPTDRLAQTGIFKLLLAADSASSTHRVTGEKEEIISLVVTIENLEVHRTGDGEAGWKSLPVTDGTVDLIALDKASWEAIISSTEIMPGNYNKIRFLLDGAEVTTNTGVYDAEVPSNTIKINVPFVVYDDGKTEITIEINPKASLIITGNKDNPKFILTPVLKISRVVTEGD